MTTELKHAETYRLAVIHVESGLDILDSVLTRSTDKHFADTHAMTPQAPRSDTV